MSVSRNLCVLFFGVFTLLQRRHISVPFVHFRWIFILNSIFTIVNRAPRASALVVFPSLFDFILSYLFFFIHLFARVPFHCDYSINSRIYYLFFTYSQHSKCELSTQICCASTGGQNIYPQKIVIVFAFRFYKKVYYARQFIGEKYIIQKFDMVYFLVWMTGIFSIVF